MFTPKEKAAKKRLSAGARPLQRFYAKSRLSSSEQPGARFVDDESLATGRQGWRVCHADMGPGIELTDDLVKR